MNGLTKMASLAAFMARNGGIGAAETVNGLLCIAHQKDAAAITAVKAALEGKDTQAIRSETEKLQKVLGEAGSAAYQEVSQRQAQQQAGHDTGHEQLRDGYVAGATEDNHWHAERHDRRNDGRGGNERRRHAPGPGFHKQAPGTVPFP